MAPALLVFAVPAFTWWFFWQTQSRFDLVVRKTWIHQVRDDLTLSPDQRQQRIDLLSQMPFSSLILREEVASHVGFTTWFDYWTFRWMIRLSAVSIVTSIGVCLMAVLGVFFSLRSQQMQYWSLLFSWHLLRIYATAQAILLAVFVIALSFWVTAIWFEFYSLKLICVVGALAVVAVFYVIAAIFRSPQGEMELEGINLPQERA